MESRPEVSLEQYGSAYSDSLEKAIPSLTAAYEAAERLGRRGLFRKGKVTSSQRLEVAANFREAGAASSAAGNRLAAFKPPRPALEMVHQCTCEYLRTIQNWMQSSAEEIECQERGPSVPGDVDAREDTSDQLFFQARDQLAEALDNLSKTDREAFSLLGRRAASLADWHFQSSWKAF
jgi:hypothetical protein